MRSRSLLLLLVLVVNTVNTKVIGRPIAPYPKVEDDIDYAKCAAKREGKHTDYQCFLRTGDGQECEFDSRNYVQVYESMRKTDLSFVPSEEVQDSELERACRKGIAVRFGPHLQTMEIELSMHTHYLGHNPILLEFSSESFTEKFYIHVEFDWIEPDTIAPPVIREVTETHENAYHSDGFCDTGNKCIFKIDPSTLAIPALKYSRKNKRVYVRFELELRLFIEDAGDDWMKSEFAPFSQFSKLTVTEKINGVRWVPVIVLGLNCGTCPKEKLNLSPCNPMDDMVLRKRPIWTDYPTKMPREAFDHNVYDFTKMCADPDFVPYHVATKQRIVAVECIENKADVDSQHYPEAHPNAEYVDAHRERPANKRRMIPVFVLINETTSAFEELKYTNVVDTYRDFPPDDKDLKKYLRWLYKFEEVTCRAKEPTCFHCQLPDWLNSSVPENLTAMVFTAGQPGACAFLGCANDSVPFYPHTGFTSTDLPLCEYNQEKRKFEWTISVQSATDWGRVREPLELGYCRKKSSCPRFTDRMLACPRTRETLPGFEVCETPLLDERAIGNRYSCPPHLQLYMAFSRQVLQQAVLGVECNTTLGEYQVTLQTGENITGFTEISWMVCRARPAPIVFDTYPPIYYPVPVRVAIGLSFAIAIYLALVGIFLLVRIPYMRWKATMDRTKLVQMEEEQNAEDLEFVKKKAKVVRKDPITKEPYTKHTLNDAIITEDRAALSRQREKEKAKKVEQAAKVEDADKLDHLAKKIEQERATTKKPEPAGPEDKWAPDYTCILPTNSQMQVLMEQERVKDATEDDDVTGREVKPIEPNECERKEAEEKKNKKEKKKEEEE